MRAAPSIYLTATILFLPACVPPADPGPAPDVVVSEVAAYHSLTDPPYWGQTIAILPWDEGEAGTAAFAAYSHELFRLLERQGLNVIPPDAGPNFWAFLGYGFEGGGASVPDYTVPEPTVAGTGSAPSAGGIHDGGFATVPPGVAPNEAGDTGSDAPYVRYVSLDILDARVSAPGEPLRVYAGRVRSAGWCGILDEVMDEMLAALFKGFPGESGAASTVRVPSDPHC